MALSVWLTEDKIDNLHFLLHSSTSVNKLFYYDLKMLFFYFDSYSFASSRYVYLAAYESGDYLII